MQRLLLSAGAAFLADAERPDLNRLDQHSG
jgi:hypothetical protein